MKRSIAPASRTLRRAVPRAFIESLEARIAPATFIVTNTSSANIAGSLLNALNQANATPNVGGPDVVAFNIPGAGPFIISPASVYTMTDPVIIDGFTQPGSSANTLAAGDNAVMQIVINGASAGGGAIGLRFTATADGSTVRGLVINGYSGNAAVAFDAGSDGHTVEGCFIGTNAAGTAATANSVGISIAGSNNTIGGATPAARNVISGNSTHGISIVGLGATGNVVAGNFIGTNAAGTGDLGNGAHGITVSDAPNLTIGGATPAARNVISGNNNLGVNIAGTLDFDLLSQAQDYLIAGNYIGTTADGSAAVGNGAGGVLVSNAADVTFSRNVVSGNVGHGVSFSSVLDNGRGLAVVGNVVGLDAGGSVALGNAVSGIVVSGPTNFTIGGLTAADRNFISANGINGIVLSSANSSAVQGNYIGTDATGTLDRGNGNIGIRILGTNSVTIGGTAAGAGNVISGNAFGVQIESTPFYTVQGNFIGTDATGLAPLGNTNTGLFVVGSSFGLIGGAAAGAGNVISANGADGLWLSSITSANTRVFGNHIGVDAAGTGAMGNGQFGVRLLSVEQVIIGGTSAGEGNVIANNASEGVSIQDGAFLTPNRVSVRGNAIFQNGGAGGLGIDLNNDGITPNDPGDFDGGVNTLQNFPLLGSAGVNSAGTTVTGVLNTRANLPFYLDFYANGATGPFGFGQGQQYLGTALAVSDATGNITFTAKLPAVAAGTFITATATNAGFAPFGETSEFSQAIAVVAAPEPPSGATGATPPQLTLASFDTGSGPVSVAAGDLDGDGLDDLVTANSKAGTVSVLLATSAGVFAEAVDYGTAGRKPAGVVLGDFNGDTFRDIAVTNAGSGTVAVLLGAGDGTFGAAATFAAGKNAGALVAARLDGDAVLDLACIIAGNKVSVLTGDGAGHFAPLTTVAVGKGPAALVAGDFDGDGAIDLATANSLANTISVLRGDGDGAFTPAPAARVGVKPVALAVGDFDGDGDDDLAVAHGTSRSVSVLLSLGDVTGRQFAAQVKIPYPGLKGARAIAAGDFDGDGRTDLVVANALAGSFSLLLGRGNGLFRGPFETHLTGDPTAMPSSIAAGDFDGDGRIDFALASLTSSEVTVALRVP